MNAKSRNRYQTKNATPKSTFSPSQLGILQRTCACGGVPGLTGECEACASERLGRQRRATNPSALPNRPLDDRSTPQMQQAILGGYSFGNLAIEPKERLGIQAKLTIGQPGDKYEQEADRVAEQVMLMPEPNPWVQRQPLDEMEDEEEKVQAKPNSRSAMQQIQKQGAETEKEEEETLQMKPLSSQSTPLIQRQVKPSEEYEDKTLQEKGLSRQASRGINPEASVVVLQETIENDKDEEKLQTQPNADSGSSTIQRRAEVSKTQNEKEEQTVQSKENAEQASIGTSTLEDKLNTNKGKGQPLPRRTRSFMESRFGHEFSLVRVHK